MRASLIFVILLYSNSLLCQINQHRLSLTNFNNCRLEALSYSILTNIEKPPSNKTHSDEWIKFSLDSTPYKVGERMEFSLFKQFILANSGNNLFKIYIPSKIQSNAYPIVFRIVGMNDKEEITFDTTLLLKSSLLTWQIDSIYIKSKNTSCINFYISYFGSKDRKQEIYLKEIILFTGQNKISQHILKNQSNDNNIEVDSITKIKTNIIPLKLFANSKPSFDKIFGNNDPNIIGLGESTHGSYTLTNAKLDFLKELILDKKIDLILLEFPDEIGFILDLIVQGKVNTKSSILEDYLTGTIATDALKDFIIWLSNYNRKSVNKIHLLGIDETDSNFKLPLMDFNVELLGPNLAKKYLEKINKNDYSEVCKLAQADSVIKGLLDDVVYKYYLEILQNKKRKTISHIQRYDRDSAMFTKVVFLDSVCRKKAKIALFAHNGHLKKTQDMTSLTIRNTLGSYLNNKYGNKYFTIGFIFGNGSFMQDSCSSYGNLINMNFNVLSKENHLESILSKIGEDHFFISSSDIDKNINRMTNIKRYILLNDYTEFASINKRFDGYIFIKDIGIDKLNQVNIFRNQFKKFSEREMMIRNILNTHTNKNGLQ